jgi:hypothetical protein
MRWRRKSGPACCEGPGHERVELFLVFDSKAMDLLGTSGFVRLTQPVLELLFEQCGELLDLGGGYGFRDVTVLEGAHQRSLHPDCRAVARLMRRSSADYWLSDEVSRSEPGGGCYPGPMPEEDTRRTEDQHLTLVKEVDRLYELPVDEEVREMLLTLLMDVQEFRRRKRGKESKPFEGV